MPLWQLFPLIRVHSTSRQVTMVLRLKFPLWYWLILRAYTTWCSWCFLFTLAVASLFNDILENRDDVEKGLPAYKNWEWACFMIYIILPRRHELERLEVSLPSCVCLIQETSLFSPPMAPKISHRHDTCQCSLLLACRHQDRERLEYSACALCFTLGCAPLGPTVPYHANELSRFVTDICIRMVATDSQKGWFEATSTEVSDASEWV